MRNWGLKIGKIWKRKIFALTANSGSRQKFTICSVLLSLLLLFAVYLPVNRKLETGNWKLRPNGALAAGARLYLKPSSGIYNVGSYLSVRVLVDTAGNKTNAFKAVLAYPPEKLSAVSVSTGGSICSLWIPPSPSYSDSAGQATLECGSPTAYRGSSGKIGEITFVVKEAGTATVSVANGSQVKKADGIGTELLSARGKATFNLQEPPEGSLTISSPTHPDQNAWYKEKKVKLSWSASAEASVNGFSYALTRSDRTVPDSISEGMGTEKTYNGLADGVWYFHLKVRDQKGWGAVSRFRIRIDTQAPKKFRIICDPPAEQISRAPFLSFVTTDRPSGIDHYEISINGSEFTVATSPYRFERIRGGVHEVTVRAVDRAGNVREAKTILKVIGVSSPTIVRPVEGEYIPFLSPLITSITVAEEGTVELYLDGQLFASLDSGTGLEVEHTYKKILFPKEYRLSAVFVSAGGIESAPAEVSFRVNAKEVYLFGLVLPGYLAYGIFALVVIFLAVIFAVFIKRVKAAVARRRKKGAKQEAARLPARQGGKELDKEKGEGKKPEAESREQEEGEGEQVGKKESAEERRAGDQKREEGEGEKEEPREVEDKPDKKLKKKRKGKVDKKRKKLRRYYRKRYRKRKEKEKHFFRVTTGKS